MLEILFHKNRYIIWGLAISFMTNQRQHTYPIIELFIITLLLATPYIG
jgi:hypothetical protein